MIAKGLLVAGLAVVVVVSGSVQTHAQKGTRVQSRPATVEFRCAFSVDAVDQCPGDAVLPDGIRADTAGAFAAQLDSVGETALNLTTGGGRFLWLDFRQGPARTDNARRHFDTLMLDSVVFHTNVVDASGNEVTGGLHSIPIAGVSRARLKIAFSTLNAAGQTIGWAVRFNPDRFPGSDHITVTRLSATTWQLEATAADRAVLVSGLERSKTLPLLLEGPFAMPFRSIVTSPAP